MSNAVNSGKRMVHARARKVIRLHWFNAVTWLLLTLSGLGIVRGDRRVLNILASRPCSADAHEADCAHEHET